MSTSGCQESYFDWSSVTFYWTQGVFLIGRGIIAEYTTIGETFLESSYWVIPRPLVSHYLLFLVMEGPFFWRYKRCVLGCHRPYGFQRADLEFRLPLNWKPGVPVDTMNDFQVRLSEIPEEAWVYSVHDPLVCWGDDQLQEYFSKIVNIEYEEGDIELDYPLMLRRRKKERRQDRHRIIF